MDQAWRDPKEHLEPDLSDTEDLELVRADLEDIEALADTARNLTALLRARLAPEEFRLVWALRDVVERLALADELLRRRRLAAVLTHRLPPSTPGHLAIKRQILGDELTGDGPA